LLTNVDSGVRFEVDPVTFRERRTAVAFALHLAADQDALGDVARSLECEGDLIAWQDLELVSFLLRDAVHAPAGRGLAFDVADHELMSLLWHDLPFS
jgi:hypothetical protein